MAYDPNPRSNAYKRLSWNMSISGTSSALEDSPVMSHQSWTTHESACPSPILGSRSRLTNRKASYRRSLQSTTEQEKEIQKWLSALARNENSRLCESIEDFMSPENGFREQCTDIQTNKYSTHNRHCSMPALRRRPVSDQYPNNLHLTRQHIASPSPTPSSTSSYPEYPSPIESKSSKRKSEGLYILTSKDFELLERAVQGPNRPGNIRGTALSWVMTADVVRTGVSALTSPDRLVEFIQFMWYTFSDPQLVLPGSMDLTLLPPHQLIVSLQPSRARIIQYFDRLQQTLVHFLCSCFSGAVIILQLALLGFMVIAYFVGGILVIPVAHLHPSLQCFTIPDNVRTPRADRRGPRKIRRAKFVPSSN